MRLVFQDYALFPHLPAWRNVAYGAARAARERSAGARRARCSSASASASLADARPADSRGGERQRVALARALARRAATRCSSTSRCRRSTRAPAPAPRASSRASSRGRGVPALLVTHDFTEAAQLGDSIAVLDNGRIVQRGSPAELAASAGERRSSPTSPARL